MDGILYNSEQQKHDRSGGPLLEVKARRLRNSFERGLGKGQGCGNGREDG